MFQCKLYLVMTHMIRHQRTKDNMKKTILSFAAIGALLASAATFEENLAAKDYVAAAA